MFKSFFPKPGAFFLSAFVWAIDCRYLLASRWGRLGGAYHWRFRADPD
ncbi:putative microcin B17 uptake protein [Escherichia coli]|uniref:Putative microcin B17 uptake protein n=1 Tax=Escherichia coli TaxID=562 RepID=A0A377AZ35_ECOLX|nr:putative microcin B17 uptake protein [Escherichia coli]